MLWLPVKDVRKKRMIGVYSKDISGVWFGVACDSQRVFGVNFACCEELGCFGLLANLPFGVPFQVFRKPSAFAERVIAWVKNVCDGKDVSNSFYLAMEHLSAYTRRVLGVTLAIPLGYVASYGSIAEMAGGGARAAGNVMALNPFAPVVPCHRIVGSGLRLGGYSGGLDVKIAFLIREKRGFTSPRDISVGGGTLQVFPVEFVLEKLERD
jgi:methylated-DNA-[protein]-cysteine S-methyltransferase